MNPYCLLNRYDVPLIFYKMRSRSLFPSGSDPLTSYPQRLSQMFSPFSGWSATAATLKANGASKIDTHTQFQFFKSVFFSLIVKVLHLFYYLMDWMTVCCISSAYRLSRSASHSFDTNISCNKLIHTGTHKAYNRHPPHHFSINSQSIHLDVSLDLSSSKELQWTRARERESEIISYKS